MAGWISTEFGYKPKPPETPEEENQLDFSIVIVGVLGSLFCLIALIVLIVQTMQGISGICSVDIPTSFDDHAKEAIVWACKEGMRDLVAFAVLFIPMIILMLFGSLITLFGLKDRLTQ